MCTRSSSCSAWPPRSWPSVGCGRPRRGTAWALGATRARSRCSTTCPALLLGLGLLALCGPPARPRRVALPRARSLPRAALWRCCGSRRSPTSSVTTGRDGCRAPSPAGFATHGGRDSSWRSAGRRGSCSPWSWPAVSCLWRATAQPGTAVAHVRRAAVRGSGRRRVASPFLLPRTLDAGVMGAAASLRLREAALVERWPLLGRVGGGRVVVRRRAIGTSPFLGRQDVGLRPVDGTSSRRVARPGDVVAVRPARYGILVDWRIEVRGDRPTRDRDSRYRSRTPTPGGVLGRRPRSGRIWMLTTVGSPTRFAGYSVPEPSRGRTA